jgi:GAF domain-containing protein
MVYDRAHVAHDHLDAWYVSNGEAVVGPVSLELLLRGVAHGRVPPDCMVRARTWGDWRALASLREISRPPSTTHVDVDTPLEPALDSAEVVLFALWTAVRATHAAVGLGHRAGAPLGPLTTRYCHGASLDARLGDSIPANDAALRAARMGCTVVRRPLGNAAGAAACRRLDGAGKPLRGVAWLPIHHRGRLFALLELGRTDHAFRQSDVDVLRALGRAASRRIASLGYL